MQKKSIQINYWIVDDDHYEGYVVNRYGKRRHIRDAYELGDLFYRLVLLY